jgi:thiol peroxidase
MSLDTTSIKGKLINLIDELPGVNETAFDFTFVKSDMTEGSLYDFEDKVKVLIGLPSLETGPCKREARRFNEMLASKKGVVGIMISKDLPYSAKKICETEGIDNVIFGSDYRYTDFTREYNCEMIDGPLKGLCARVVFVVDKNNNIKYVELTKDVTDEPQYEKVLAAVDSLI